MTEVPVHVARGLSPAQIKAYRIADNQTARLAEWDYDKLPLEIAELQGMDFDLNLTGFSAEELMELLAPASTDGQTDPDAIPEPPDEAITQPGDVWVLAQHRLVCGDSSNPEDVDKLLAGAPIHLVNWGRGTRGDLAGNVQVHDVLRFCQPPRTPPTSRRRLLRWAIIGAVVAVTVAVGQEWELREAIAETYQLDPGWRFEDIEAARAGSMPTQLATGFELPILHRDKQLRRIT